MIADGFWDCILDNATVLILYVQCFSDTTEEISHLIVLHYVKKHFRAFIARL